jgi:GT2 family glycosyltransferase
VNKEHKIILSIIIVGYNGTPYLANCIDSLFDQTLSREAYEIIYIDNNSTDNSVAFVQDHFPDVVVVACEKNLGYYGGFNHVAKTIAHGEYLLALPQDTILHRECLQSLVQVANNDPQMMIGLANTINPFSSEYEAKDLQGWPQHVYWFSMNRFGQTNMVVHKFFQESRPILAYSGISALIRSDVQHYLGGYFDDTLSHLVGDTELGIRANVLGYSCKIIPTAVIFHIEDNKKFTNRVFLWRSFVAARDSIVIYWKLMYSFEFLLFTPFLLFGQATKVFTLRFPFWQRLILFIPALLLSPVTFIFALTRMTEFSQSRKDILDRRTTGYFYLLRTTLMQHLS